MTLTTDIGLSLNRRWNLPAKLLALLHLVFLAAVILVGWEIMIRAPGIETLETVRIPASLASHPDGFVLGKEILGQNTSRSRAAQTAAQQHLKVSYRGGQWILQNVASNRKVWVRTDAGWGFNMRSWFPRQGDRIRTTGLRDDAVLEVTQASPDRIRLQSPEDTVEVFGENLGWQRRLAAWNILWFMRDFAPYKIKGGRGTDPHLAEPCASGDWASTSVTYLGDIGENCGNFTHVSALQGGSVALRDYEGRMAFVPHQFSDDGRLGPEILFSPPASGDWFTFDDIEWPLVDSTRYGRITSLILGRTTYLVELEGDGENAALTLRAVADMNTFPTGSGRFAAPEPGAPLIATTRRSVSVFSASPWSWRSDAVATWISLVTGITVFVLLIRLIAPLLNSDRTKGARLVNFGHISDGLVAGLVLGQLVSAAGSDSGFYGYAPLGSVLNSIGSDLHQFLRLLPVAGTLALIALSFLRQQPRGWLAQVFLMSFSVLLMSGLLNMALLAAGGDNTRWVRYWLNSVDFALLGAATVYFACRINLSLVRSVLSAYALPIFWSNVKSTSVYPPLNVVQQAALLALPFLLMIGLYSAWLAVGSETGAGGFQPIEFAKIVFLWLLASMVAPFFLGRLYNKVLNLRPATRPFLFYLVAILLIFGLAILAPAVLNDMSPTLLLGLVCFWALPIGSVFLSVRLVQDYLDVPPEDRDGLSYLLHPGAASLLALVAVSLLGGWMYVSLNLDAMLLSAGETIADLASVYNYAPLDTVAERFAIWHSPYLMEDLADQLFDATWAVEVGWASNWSERIAAISMPADVRVMTTAAIHDDFILAYFIYRLGGWMSLVLMTTQFIFVGVILFQAGRLLGMRIEPQEAMPSIAVAQYSAYLMTLIAVLFALQWTLSYGNVFGALPIMGQPMTFLSAGGSHFLAMIGGGVAFLVLGFRQLEESER